MTRRLASLAFAAQLLAAAPVSAAQRSSGSGPSGPAALPAPASPASAAAAKVPALVELSALLNTPVFSDAPIHSAPKAADAAAPSAATAPRGVSADDIKLAAFLNRVPFVPEALGLPLETGVEGAEASRSPAAVEAAVAGIGQALSALSLEQVETMPLEDLDGVARKVMDEVLRARSIEGEGSAGPPAPPAPPLPPSRQSRGARLAKRLPWMTGSLLAVNTAVYAAETQAVERGVYPSALEMFRDLGLWPYAVREALQTHDLSELVFRAATLGTHMFMHSGPQHLAMNLAALLAYGLFIERVVGAARMLKLYLAAGLLGGAAHLAFSWGSPHAMLGASGAVAALIGAYVGSAGFLGAEKRQGRPLAGSLLGLLRLYVLLRGGFWILGELAALFSQLSGALEDGVAHDVHVAGIVVGLSAALRWRAQARREATTPGGGPGPSAGSEGTRP